MTFNEFDHPRTAAGAPGAGEFATKPGGAEGEAGLLGAVGASVDDELIEVLRSVMVERRLGAPGNPSAERTLRAAADYMHLPEFQSLETQARHALFDVRNAAEVNETDVVGTYGPAYSRLHAGEMVPVTARINGHSYEGEAFLSSDTGKVWFIADNAYPDGYRGDSVNPKALRAIEQQLVSQLNLDNGDPDNDFDLVFEVAKADEDTAHKAWDYMRTSNPNAQSATVASAVALAKKAEPLPASLLPAASAKAALNHGERIVVDGREGFAFPNTGRPDHVWVAWDE